MDLGYDTNGAKWGETLGVERDNMNHKSILIGHRLLHSPRLATELEDEFHLSFTQ